MPPKIVRNAAPGDAADFGCNLLDNDHQGKAEQKGPRKLKSKLRANFAMRGDPARVVVCRSGYEARTQPSPKPQQWRADPLFRCFVHGLGVEGLVGVPDG